MSTELHRAPWSRPLVAIAFVAVVGAGLGAFFGIRAVQGAGSGTASGQPAARIGAAMAYDAASRTVVLFGGQDRSRTLDDTWTWDGTNWTKRHPTKTPPGFGEATPFPQQMVYDPARKVILFVLPVQHAASTADNTMDTWTWNGVTWTRLNPAASPPLRDGNGLAYDAKRSLVVFAGGFPFGGADPTTTWGWNGVTWSELGGLPA